jgi:hypothetical protein
MRRSHHREPSPKAAKGAGAGVELVVEGGRAVRRDNSWEVAILKTERIAKVSGLLSLMLLGTILIFGSMGVHDAEFYLVTVPCGMLLMMTCATFLICKLVERGDSRR